MRRLTFILLLSLGVACTATKNAGEDNIKLKGTWIPVSQELGGKPLPKAAYEHQTLVIAGGNYIVTAESVDKGTVTRTGDKMDIYGKEGVNAGKHFTAIYKYENGILTICYNLRGDGYPQSFDTKGKPMFFLSVFRKA